jgi:nitrogen regulation protein NR(I)
MSAVRICVVDDDEATRTSLAEVLTSEGYLVTQAADGVTALELGRDERFAAVLTDVRMPRMDGLALVDALHQAKPNLPIVVMTAHGTTESAIEATRRGAFEYLLKPFDMEELLAVLDKAVAAGRRAEETVDLGDEATGEPSAHARLVGRSRAMQALYKEVGRVADRPVTVLILGETGTGKELVARALYQHSDRAGRPFVAVNCAAIPDILLESELFGHERGAFTGADARRIGRFEQAHGGTLFLDEIGDLSAGTQAKLLRVLQDRVVTRLGGRDPIPIDVRVIAATHRDLARLVGEGGFREDLYYRLAVVNLTLPPLRERPEDIAPTVAYFLKRHGPELGAPEAEITPAALRWLKAQPWPGNVRQLENAVKRALLLSRGFTVDREHVEAAAAPGASAVAAEPSASAGLARLVAAQLEEARSGRSPGVEPVLVELLQRELYAQALALAGGNLTQAARWIGISRLTLRERMAQLGLREGPAKGDRQEG